MAAAAAVDMEAVIPALVVPPEEHLAVVVVEETLQPEIW